MVLHKRLDYGFHGYQVPPTPRAPRSARRRSSFKKMDDGNQMCAFDLLATIAGKLLVEGESSAASYSNTLVKKQHIVEDSVKKQDQIDDKHLKVEPSYQEGCAPFSDQSSKGLFQSAPNEGCSGHESVLTTTSDCSGKALSAEILVKGNNEVEIGTFRNKVEVGNSGYSRESCDYNVEHNNNNKKKKETKSELVDSGKLAMSSSEDHKKPPALVSSVDNSVKLSFCSFPTGQNDVKLVNRDDDDKLSRFTQPSSTTRAAYRPPPRVGNWKIKKLLASKYWKGTPNLKGDEPSSYEIKSVYRNRKHCYKRKRSQRDYPFKKRKIYDRSSVSNPEWGISNEGVSSSFGKKGFNGDASTIQGANGPSASVGGQRSSFMSRDSHVKLRIKSFKVPELFIEIPDTATVGSLKRTVMEAVTAILGGGLRVGVLLQGKKIRDDSKTLQQSGISRDNKPDALGFTLEPNPSQTPQPILCAEDGLFLESSDPPPQLTRFPPTSDVLLEQGSSGVSLDVQVPNFGSAMESDHDSAPSPPDISVDKNMIESRSLVLVPAVNNAAALAVVPMRKSKRSEVAQRRIRRPFSVSEVEALVQAVEKLGTGRWRDVKLRAFDNAKHRTYVDLKDKWKTLVHTARISPQQRRGEPVPQELLDRVLTAHSYWSHHQAKQQIKQQSDTCRLL